MLKKYKAKSFISISVTLATGGNTHISFSPVTGGGSVYYTENEKIQAGLEGHPKYGKLFTLEETVANATGTTAKAAGTTAKAAGTTAKAVVPQPTTEEGTQQGAEGASDGEGTGSVYELKAACNDDAKDWLADKFGVSRSKMRSRQDIEKVAEDNGVKVVWV